MADEGQAGRLDADKLRLIIRASGTREPGAMIGSVTTLAIMTGLDEATLMGVVGQAERFGWVSLREGRVYAARPQRGVPELVRATDFVRSLVRESLGDDPLGTVDHLAGRARVAPQTMGKALGIVMAEGRVAREPEHSGYRVVGEQAAQGPRGGPGATRRKRLQKTRNALLRAAMDAPPGRRLGTLEELAGDGDLARYSATVLGPVEATGWVQALPDRTVVSTRPPLERQPPPVRVMDAVRAQLPRVGDGGRLGTRRELAERLGVSQADIDVAVRRLVQLGEVQRWGRRAAVFAPSAVARAPGAPPRGVTEADLHRWELGRGKLVDAIRALEPGAVLGTVEEIAERTGVSARTARTRLLPSLVEAGIVARRDDREYVVRDPAAPIQWQPSESERAEPEWERVANRIEELLRKQQPGTLLPPKPKLAAALGVRPGMLDSRVAQTRGQGLPGRAAERALPSPGGTPRAGPWEGTARPCCVAPAGRYGGARRAGCPAGAVTAICGGCGGGRGAVAAVGAAVPEGGRRRARGGAGAGERVVA